jgi:hypothetical protein
MLEYVIQGNAEHFGDQERDFHEISALQSGHLPRGSKKTSAVTHAQDLETFARSSQLINSL